MRYDLNWQSHRCKEEYFDENGIWKGSPEKSVQEFRLNYGTNNWNLRKSNSNILPANTILLDLTTEEEQILWQMKPKTRYNIKLAQRKGIHVKSADIEELGVWHRLYCDTATRNGLHVNSLEYYQ